MECGSRTVADGDAALMLATLAACSQERAPSRRSRYEVMKTKWTRTPTSVGHRNKVIGERPGSIVEDDGRAWSSCREGDAVQQQRSRSPRWIRGVVKPGSRYRRGHPGGQRARKSRRV